MELYIILIPLLIILIWLKVTRSKRIGQRGESYIAYLLEKLPDDEYVVLNDLMLSNEYGASQIDHVVLSVYGIFVIETKNYSGLIYGGERAEYWTKNVYGNKYKFRNPIKQNYGHIKALSNKLDISTNLFTSIVVFTRRAKLKGDYESPVIYANRLIDEIKYHNTVKLTKKQIDDCKIILNLATSYKKEDQKKHIDDIKNNVNERNRTVRNGICPKCGGLLKQRKGKYGMFYGCSNYPKCKFTINN